MSSNVIDSKEVFLARLKALNLTDLAEKFKANGWVTLGKFAFAVSFGPGAMASSEEFHKGVLVPLLADRADFNCAEKYDIRRLYFEAHSMMVADMARRVAPDPEPERPRNLPVEERAQRLQVIKDKIKPSKVSGETEPSDNLVDKLSTMQEAGVLRYIAWEDITRRDLEVQGVKKEKYWMEDKDGRFKGFEATKEDPADLSSDLRLERMFRRRAIAFDMHLMSYEAHEELSTYYLEEMCRDPPSGHSKITIQQVRETDKEIFVRMADLTRVGLPYDPDNGNVYPLDQVLRDVLKEPRIVLMMNNRPLGRQTNDQTSHGEKRKESRIAQLEAELRKAKAQNINNSKGGGIGAAFNKGKGKGQKTGKGAKAGKNPGGSMPAELIGLNSTLNGKRICFAYNCNAGCKNNVDKSGGCFKGLHSCARCGGNHPQHSPLCPKRE